MTSQTKLTNTGLTVEDLGVMLEVAHERVRQVDRHGYDRSHDAQHDVKEWAWLLLRRITDLMHPWQGTTELGDQRRLMIELAAITVAGIVALDENDGWPKERTDDGQAQTQG
jgi:ABC-type branched-subunit amino acid transport system ATPase component